MTASSTQQTPSTFFSLSTQAINPLLSFSNTRVLCLDSVTIPLLSQKFLLTHLVFR